MMDEATDEALGVRESDVPASEVGAPNRQAKRSREELRALMLTAAQEILLEDGLGVGAEPLTFRRVFERVERDTGLRLTNASIIRRVWENQNDYHTDVLVDIASDFAFVENDATFSALAPLRRTLDLSTPEKRLLAVREFARVGGEAAARTLSESPGWALWIGVWALATAGELTDQKKRIREELWASYEAGNAYYLESYQALTEVVGLRLREGLTMRQFVVAAGAMAEGCTLRNRLDAHLTGFTLPTGPNGEDQEWTLLGIGIHALLERFFEIDPDWEPPARPHTDPVTPG
jgi:hypothetical protein